MPARGLCDELITRRILFCLSETADICHIENISNENFRPQLDHYSISANDESILQKKENLFWRHVK
jgi:hypothetical protein